MNTPNTTHETIHQDQITPLYDEGLRHLQAGDAAQALDLLIKGFRMIYASNDQTLLGQVLVGMGEAYLSLAQIERAEDCFTTALKMDSTGSPALQLSASAGLARIARQNGNYDEASLRFSEAIKTARELQELAAEASLLNDLAELQYETGQSKDAAATFTRALEAAHAVQSAESEARAHCGLALIAQASHNQNNAATHIEQALLVLRRVENQQVIDTSRAKLVRVMEAAGISQRLIEFEFALVSAYSTGVTERVINTHIEIAQVLNQQGKMDKALAHLESARAYSQRFSDRRDEGRIVKAIAGIYEANSLAYMALSVYDEWVKAVRDSGDLEVELQALEGAAQAHQKMGQLSNSIDVLQRAILLAQTKCDRYLEAGYLYKQALVHLQMGSTESSCSILERAKKVLPANTDPAMASDIDRHLSELRPQSITGLSNRVSRA